MHINVCKNKPLHVLNTSNDINDPEKVKSMEIYTMEYAENTWNRKTTAEYQKIKNSDVTNNLLSNRLFQAGQSYLIKRTDGET